MNTTRAKFVLGLAFAGFLLFPDAVLAVTDGAGTSATGGATAATGEATTVGDAATGGATAATGAIEEEPSGQLTAWQAGQTAAAWEAIRRFGPDESQGIGSLALHDLDGDGQAETLVGAGIGQPPFVTAYDDDGTPLHQFAAYDSGMFHGVNLAVGDLDGNGNLEIITGTGPDAAGHVRILGLDGQPRLLAAGFFPFGTEQRGGVRVAAGDLDGDGRDELIAASGPGEKPRVTVWRVTAGQPPRSVGDFAPFEGETAPGLSLAVADFDQDGSAELAVARAGTSEPLVRIFDLVAGVAHQSGEFSAINHGFRGGLNLAAADLNDDSWPDILAAPNTGGGPHVHAYDRHGLLLGRWFAGEEDYRGGLLLASYRPERAGLFRAASWPGTGVPTESLGAGNPVVLTAPAGLDQHGLYRPYEPRYINVSVAEQRLRAYEYGRLVRSFYVSTGKAKTPTPLGEFSVLAKPYKVHYTWSYGPDHPENYDLGWVPYNLRFYPHIYIHYAPWHNNFGYRMSHGCVNLNLTNAKWIYGWAEVGTPVTVQWERVK